MDGNYAMYLRKSRADLTEPEETLAVHEKILDEYAERNHIKVTKKYKEIVSGETIDDRPEMMALLNDVSEGMYNGVLVVELERLARGNGIDQAVILETFKSTNTLILTPGKTYDPMDDADEQFFELGLMLSRIEYKTIRKRLARGKLEAVKEGQYCARKPYGYDLINGKLQVNPVEAPIVQEVFRRFADGETASVIFRSLKVRGIKSPSGRPEWSISQLYPMVKNQLYLGHLVYGATKIQRTFDREKNKVVKKRVPNENPIIVKNSHPALVDQATFDACQNWIEKRIIKKAGSKTRHPLAKLVYCPNCGHVMRYDKGRFFHNSKARREGKCCEPWTRYTYDMQEVYDEIVKALTDITNGLKLEMENDSEIDQLEARKKALETELKSLKDKKASLYDLFEDGIYTKDEFVKRRATYDERIKGTTEELESIVIPEKVDVEDTIIRIARVIEDLEDQTLDIDTKHTLLSSIVKKIELEPIEIGSHGREGTHRVANFTLHLYLKQTKKSV